MRFVLLSLSLLIGQLVVAQTETNQPSAKPVSTNKTATAQVSTNMPNLAEIKTAAEAGDHAAQYKLARAYEDRFELATAAQWFRPAAESGIADAQYRLARILDRSYEIRINRRVSTVKRDAGQAAAWFQQAANQDHALAQFALGKCYATGSGVAQDYPEAYKWLSLAAKKDDEEARSLRDKLILKMSADQIAEGQKRTDAFQPTHPAAEKDKPAAAAEPAAAPAK